MLRALGGEIDGFVSVVGSAGTLLGTSKYLKRKSPHVVCAAVEPKGDASLADHIISVQDEETLEMKDDLARIEGVFVGFTVAANVVASIKLYDMDFLRKGAKVGTGQAPPLRRGEVNLQDHERRREAHL